MAILALGGDCLHIGLTFKGQELQNKALELGGHGLLMLDLADKSQFEEIDCC